MRGLRSGVSLLLLLLYATHVCHGQFVVPTWLCPFLRVSFLTQNCINKPTLFCYGVALLMKGNILGPRTCLETPCVDYFQRVPRSCRGLFFTCPVESINVNGICNIGQVCCELPPNVGPNQTQAVVTESSHEDLSFSDLATSVFSALLDSTKTHPNIESYQEVLAWFKHLNLAIAHSHSTQHQLISKDPNPNALKWIKPLKTAVIDYIKKTDDVTTHEDPNQPVPEWVKLLLAVLLESTKSQSEAAKPGTLASNFVNTIEEILSNPQIRPEEINEAFRKLY